MFKKILKKKAIILIIVVLCFGILYFLFHKDASSDLALVSVSKGNITSHAEAVGYIKPLHSSIVKSQISGTVEEIYHAEGDFVTKGTPLVKIKPAPEPADYASAYQELADASALEKNSELDINRFQKALASKLITPYFSEYIVAQKTHTSARLRRILAAQKLALLDHGVTKVGGKSIANVVVSPIDGYVLSRNVDIGDPVISLGAAQSATALFAIADMHDLIFQGLVDEMDAARIRIGFPALIKIGSMPDKKIMGTITRISLQSDKENTSQGVANLATTNSSPFNVGFKVEITKLQIPKELTLRSGYSATATIDLEKANNVLVLPMRVIQFKDDKPFVLLPKKGNKTPESVPIIAGLTDGVNTEIKNGLRLGDKVVDKPNTPVDND